MDVVTCVSTEHFFQQWEIQDNMAVHAARCIEYARIYGLIDEVLEKASLRLPPTDLS